MQDFRLKAMIKIIEFLEWNIIIVYTHIIKILAVAYKILY